MWKAYTSVISPVLHDFAGKPFEGLSREWMWRESAAGRLPFRARAVGRWWDRQDEIDVMAADNASDAAIVGECKFRNAPVDRSVLNLLRDQLRELVSASEHTCCFRSAVLINHWSTMLRRLNPTFSSSASMSCFMNKSHLRIALTECSSVRAIRKWSLYSSPGVELVGGEEDGQPDHAGDDGDAVAGGEAHQHHDQRQERQHHPRVTLANGSLK